MGKETRMKDIKWVGTVVLATAFLTGCSVTFSNDQPKQEQQHAVETKAEEKPAVKEEEPKKEASQQPATVSNYEQLSGYVYVATGRVDDGLNLRQGPGVKYAKVLSYEMPNGTMLQLQGKQGNWLKVSVENSNIEGWVNGKYTSANMPSYTENHYDTIYVAIYGDTLAMRTGPSVKYGKIGDLVYSEKLYVYRTSGKWAYVYAPSQNAYGWVNSEYTVSTLESNVQTMTVNVHNDTLVLREGAGKNTAELARLGNGTTVEVHDKQGAWYKVYVPSLSKWGWMHSGFLKFLHFGKNYDCL